MAHFAQLDDDNNVRQVIVADSVEWCQENLGGRWLQTSYNTRGGVHYNPETGEPSEEQSKALRKNFASGGFTYDESLDAFIPPKEFKAWVLNTETCLWEPPFPKPEDGLEYKWDDAVDNWVVGDWVEEINPSEPFSEE